MDAFLRVERGLIQDYGMSTEIPLDTDMLVIGRPLSRSNPESEIPHIKIKDDFVSHEHMKIFFSYENAAFVIQERDMGSTNGTFINNERIVPSRSYVLRDGDLIGLAKVEGSFRVVLRFRESENTLSGPLKLERTSVKGINVDLVARRVWVDSNEIPLCRKQFDLLAFLYQNEGKACSKNIIAEKVWAEEHGIVTQETIEQTIHRIRTVIEPDRSKPRYIKTIHGGYRLDL